YKFSALTGGDEGLRVLRPLLLGQPFAELDKVGFLTGPFYYYALALLAVAALVMRRIVRSPLGLSLRAIRENADKAAFVGVSVRRYRFYAFVIAAVFGAVGGTLLAVPTGLADPLLAYWTHSGNLVFMLLLGGFEHFLGPLVGALAFIFLQDLVMSLTAYWRFVFGALLAIDPVRLARLGLARSFQLAHVFPGLTVAETLAVAILARRRRGARLFASLAAERATWDEAAGVAELFGLADALGRPARTLPQGDKKLLDVASAFALHPEVILLDEPTSGVSTADKHA